MQSCLLQAINYRKQGSRNQNPIKGYTRLAPRNPQLAGRNTHHVTRDPKLETRNLCLLPRSNLTDRNRQFFTILDFVDTTIPYPDHPIRNIEHFKIVGGRNHCYAPFLTQPF